jgi:hypothetical protein
MKAVYQTKYGRPNGNCWMACIASILEVPLETCPDLSKHWCDEDAPDWWIASYEFVREHGFQLICLPVERRIPPVLVWPDGHTPRGLSIASGMVYNRPDYPNGIMHACVALNGDVIHDPNNLHGEGLDFISDYTVLVPICPNPKPNGRNFR